MHASPCLPSHSESSLIHAFRHAQEGCAFALGAPLQDIWQATLPPSIDVDDGMWGLHILNDTDVWHTMQTRARYPNRVPDAGVRDTKFSQIGANATWEEMVYKGPGSQLGHQHVSNATNEIPKNVTVFPDAFVYVSNAWKERSCLENSSDEAWLYPQGVGGLCGPDYVGYDPPGGYVCSVHGGMVSACLPASGNERLRPLRTARRRDR